MLIADSQVHIWSRKPAEGTRPGHHTQRAVFSKDDLLAEMDRAGVDRAVISPQEGQLDHAFEAVLGHPARFAISGVIDLRAAESREQVKNWRSQPGMLALRMPFHTKERVELFRSGATEWVWSAAQKDGIPVMVWAAHVLSDIPALAEKYPDLNLVIDHFGVDSGSGLKDAAAFAHLPKLLSFSRYPNVSIKASGLAGYSTDPYPFRNISDHIHAVYDAFGPDRIYWGTDLTRMTCSYRQCVTHFTEELPFLSASDKDQIMGGGLCRLLGWPAS